MKGGHAVTRESFIIAYRDKETVKYKFNSACREIEKIVKGIAIAEHTDYTLTGSSIIKNGFYAVAGSRQWTGKNGNIVDFTINKL